MTNIFVGVAIGIVMSVLSVAYIAIAKRPTAVAPTRGGLVEAVPAIDGWYLEVNDCSWHKGQNPRELQSWWIDLNGIKRLARVNGWTPDACLTPRRPSKGGASLEWIAYCEMHDLFARCLSGTEQGGPWTR